MCQVEMPLWETRGMMLYIQHGLLEHFAYRKNYKGIHFSLMKKARSLTVYIEKRGFI